MTNTKRLFPLICLAHVLIWTLAASLFQKNGALDVVEAIAWGGQWQFGYDRDPFLVAWLAKLVSYIGGSTLWSIYLLSQLCIVAAFWAVYQLAKDMRLNIIHALMAVIFLEGIFYYHFTTPEFNDNVLQIPMWSLTALFYYRALTNQKITNWLLTGFFLALSLLAKYFTIMLIVPMAMLLVTTEQGRKSFKQSGIYCAAIVCLIIFSPNLYWQYQHNWSYIHYALHRADVRPSILNHVIYPVKFIFAQLIALSPALALWMLTTTPTNNRLHQMDFNAKFLLIMALCPLLTTVMYSAITGTQMRSMWGTPLFSMMGLMIIYFFQPDTRSFKKYVIAFAGFFILSLVSYIAMVSVSPYFLGYAKNEFYPSQAIAQDLTKLWRQTTHRKLDYVAGQRRLSARVSVYSKDHPAPYFDWDDKTSPWISAQDVKQKGAIFVWDANKSGPTLPDHILQQYPRAKILTPREYAWQTGADINEKVKIGVAILPPSR